MKNCRGMIHIGTILIILALIGLWFVIKSYQSGRLVENMGVVLSDYRKVAVGLAKDEKTKEQINLIFEKIKYLGPNDSGTLKSYLDEVNRILEEKKYLVGDTDNSR